MQNKCKKLLQELFPEDTIRVIDKSILFNKPQLTDHDLEQLKSVEGMYKDRCIKRSGTGLVVILKF